MFLARPKPEPVVEAPPAEPPKAARSTALTEETLEIPAPEVDAGKPPPAEDPAPTTKKPRRPGDSWSCQGDIPAKQIKQVLADSQTQIRSCYERQLRNNNMLQGSVNLQVKVGAGGKVVATRARGSLGDKEVLSCMQNLAKNWSFPAPEGGPCAVFDAPYNFTPKN